MRGLCCLSLATSGCRWDRKYYCYSLLLLFRYFFLIKESGVTVCPVRCSQGVIRRNNPWEAMNPSFACCLILGRSFLPSELWGTMLCLSDLLRPLTPRAEHRSKQRLCVPKPSVPLPAEQRSVQQTAHLDPVCTGIWTASTWGWLSQNKLFLLPHGVSLTSENWAADRARVQSIVGVGVRNKACVHIPRWLCPVMNEPASRQGGSFYRLGWPSQQCVYLTAQGNKFTERKGREEEGKGKKGYLSTRASSRVCQKCVKP